MRPEYVHKMKPEAVADYLFALIVKLDKLDCEDYFGTEGWRHLLMGED